jgi:hypothetical protein
MLEWSAGLRPIALRRMGWPRLRHAGGLGLLFLGLGGCMTTGAPAVPPLSFPDATPGPAVNISAVAPEPVMAEQVKPTPRPKKSVHERRMAQARVPREKISAIDPHHLIGLEPGAVQQLLGPPGRVENSDLSREWVYASGGCSFRLFFYPNLNTAAFRVLKYGGNDGNGELLDVSDTCIRRILMAKKNATG